MADHHPESFRLAASSGLDSHLQAGNCQWQNGMSDKETPRSCPKEKSATTTPVPKQPSTDCRQPRKRHLGSVFCNAAKELAPYEYKRTSNWDGLQGGEGFVCPFNHYLPKRHEKDILTMVRNQRREMMPLKKQNIISKDSTRAGWWSIVNSRPWWRRGSHLHGDALIAGVFL